MEASESGSHKKEIRGSRLRVVGLELWLKLPEFEAPAIAARFTAAGSRITEGPFFCGFF